jgi:LAS superfamily LD-carboxypeptidase LdcB
VSGDIALTTVRGITVASEIADELEGLLAAAEADGFTFGGGGYRSSDSQVQLRREHCGTSDYAIYEMSPSQCSPPTARPGQSNHERGLAVDFTHNGRVISSRSSDAFRWLSNNAGSFGFRNLPSEPWHWSTNGQ